MKFLTNGRTTNEQRRPSRIVTFSTKFLSPFETKSCCNLHFNSRFSKYNSNPSFASFFLTGSTSFLFSTLQLHFNYKNGIIKANIYRYDVISKIDNCAYTCMSRAFSFFKNKKKRKLANAENERRERIGKIGILTVTHRDDQAEQ